MSLIPRKSSDAAGDAHTMTGNVLGPDVKIKGTLKVREGLLFNASIEGAIIAGAHLTLAEHAIVTGEVSAETLTLHGTVHGNVTVTGKAQLKSGGALHGDLNARRVEMEEGTTFVGQAKIASGKG